MNSINMIARVWRGWTSIDNADIYEKLLREVVYPELQKIVGYKNGYILRRNCENEVEFITINYFESLDAVKAFAGSDYETPVFEPEARKLLLRIESKASHYEVRHPFVSDYKRPESDAI